VKRVLTAAVLIPIVVLALFKAPLWLFTLLVFAVAVLAAQEYFAILKAQGYRPFAAPGYIFFALSFGTLYWAAYYASLDYVDGAGGLALIVILGLLGGLALITLVAALIFLLGGLRRDPLSSALPDASVTFMALPYLAYTLGLLVLLRAPANGALYVLYLMLLVWCGDIAAYYVGRAVGKHKLAPRVSPGKSWEGAVASVLAAVIVGVVLMHFLAPISDFFRSFHLLNTPRIVPQSSSGEASDRSAPYWLVALFAICVNVSAQLGDLVESALKRGAGVKDSGTLLPGHGGVLDRIDALLFALPVGFIFYLAGLGRYFSAL
jgi:phosphatidate cytidylyltransferase